MRLIRFITPSGIEVWINPDKVRAVISGEREGQTKIWLGEDDDFWFVAEPLASVIERLTDSA